MTVYQKFQEWLNDCPVKILDYQDFTDQFQITFEVELEEEVNNEEKTIDYRGNSYAENVDSLVARMGSGWNLLSNTLNQTIVESN